MSAESYRAAMRAPIYTSNGGASVNRGTGLHYVEDEDDTHPVTAESVQGMAVNGWCWLFGALSILIWTAFVLIVR